MPKPSKLANDIEHELERTGRYARIRFDHSDYILRYQTKTGVGFAVGRTAGSVVRFWVLAADETRRKFTERGIIFNTSVPKMGGAKGTGTGRNSNLDQVNGFRNSVLDYVKVRMCTAVTKPSTGAPPFVVARAA